MILPDFILPSRVNQRWEYSGMDSVDLCKDQTHFKQYPHAISYQYNSRGFRDQEWPNSIDELKNAIWCVGDSFTVGLGSPLEHTWPWLLQNQTRRRVINISMDGASNNWIARRTAIIQQQIAPKNIVVMWSYVHRREHKNSKLDDEQRRLHLDDSSDIEDILNLKQCIEAVENNNVIQLAIPFYLPFLDVQASWGPLRAPDWPALVPGTLDELRALPEFIQSELKNRFNSWTEFESLIELNNTRALVQKNVIQVNNLDLARDGHHFDIITAQWVVEQIVNILDQQN
jgi:hypothetical protein